ncbi:MAG TPA: glycoside hydrolase family 30 beta sandwich domain-containing protein, partial [Polyangiaceae bacterium]
SAAIAGFAIHGYGSDGVSSAGASSQMWAWWANGWQTSPAAGIPATVKGFASYGKPSWMTETSGEKPEWLASSSTGGFPDQGAFSIAVKIHQALTTGQQSAWLYWQLTDGSPADDAHVEPLTDATQLANGPKYVAAKHFFRAVRPGAQRVAATVGGGSTTLLASAFVQDATGSLTVVLVNEAATAATVEVDLPATPAGITSLSAFTSSSGKLWQASAVNVAGGKASIPVPGYGVVTLTGGGTPAPSDGGAEGAPGTGDAAVSPEAGGGDDGGAGGGDNATPAGSSGCGCRTADAPGSSLAALLAMVTAAALVTCRRASAPRSAGSARRSTPPARRPRRSRARRR